MRDLKGDPIRERKTREELLSIKNKISQQDQQNVNDKLALTEAMSKLGNENRELIREKNILNKRLEECETLLTQKSYALDKSLQDLDQIQDQFSGMQSSLLILEEKNKKLTEDNGEYVKQMIDMKESRARFMNDFISGKIPQQDVS